MVKQRTQLDQLFAALADGTRREILRRLTAGECNIGELSDPFEISLVAVSKHVRKLESAGLIEREIRGREHVCRLVPEAMTAAHRWLDGYAHFWNERLDALESLLAEQNDRENQKYSR